jgi:hypothetical protein
MVVLPVTLPPNRPEFNTMPEAAHGLLIEACTIANSSGLKYAVCGGWSTVLRNCGRISHPGTRDVDLLFSQATKVGALKEVICSFLQEGYLPSAKHDFQLLRVQDVGTQKFVFNVDFLHPTEYGNTAPLFVDHLDISTSTGETVLVIAKERSMALPDSQTVFEEDLFVTEEVHYRTADGQPRSLTIPLLDEVGLLITKSKSCSSPKRPRDLLDIYLAVMQPRDANTLRSKLFSLQARTQVPFKCISRIRAVLEPEGLSPDVKSAFQQAGLNPVSAVQEIRDFLDEIGIPKSERFT